MLTRIRDVSGAGGIPHGRSVLQREPPPATLHRHGICQDRKPPGYYQITMDTIQSLLSNYYGYYQVSTIKLLWILSKIYYEFAMDTIKSPSAGATSRHSASAWNMPRPETSRYRGTSSYRITMEILFPSAYRGASLKRNSFPP